MRPAIRKGAQKPDDISDQGTETVGEDVIHLAATAAGDELCELNGAGTETTGQESPVPAALNREEDGQKNAGGNEEQNILIEELPCKCAGSERAEELKINGPRVRAGFPCKEGELCNHEQIRCGAEAVREPAERLFRAHDDKEQDPRTEADSKGLRHEDQGIFQGLQDVHHTGQHGRSLFHSPPSQPRPFKRADD